MNGYSTKKERTEGTVELDLELLSIATVVKIVEDMKEEIYYQRDENKKLKSSDNSHDNFDTPSSDMPF